VLQGTLGFKIKLLIYNNYANQPMYYLQELGKVGKDLNQNIDNYLIAALEV
jgi:hypothetical protein